MSFKIEPKDGVEVYLSETGYLCVKQIGPTCSADNIVTVHRDDIEDFMEIIKKVYQEHLDYIPPEDEQT